MNKQNCTTLKFADLFGLNIVAQTILKSNKYELGASFRPKTIPNPGSPYMRFAFDENDNEYKYLINKKLYKIKEDVSVDKVINHKNGDITLLTASGNLRFWKNM